MRGTSSRPFVRPRSLAVLVCITAFGFAAGCAENPDQALRPLHAPQRSRTSATAPSEAPPPTAQPSTTGSSEPAPRTDPAATSGAAPVTPDGRITVVDAVLDRYDRTLTAVLRHPGDALRDGDPAFAAWSATVAPGAVLADDIRSVVTGRAGAGEAVEPPTAGQLSYVHRAVSIHADSASVDPDALSFTWCGWSPGVVHDTATGAVADDGVSHTTGTGTLRRVGQNWLLASLDETTIEVLPAGSPDPCPAART